MRQELHYQDRERRRTERRRRRVSLVLRERRSGFDRRAAQGSRANSSFTCLLTGLRDSPACLGSLLVAVNVFNLADFWLTLNVLALGGGEANPILRPLFAAGPVYAGSFKFVIVFAVTLIVWSCRRFRRALEAALIMAGAFGAVLVYHIIGLLVYH